MTIVYTPGVFDLFHFGHLDYLRRAKLHGDILVVGVQSDASVEKQKGRAPIIRQEQRVAIIENLIFVDHVMIYCALDHCNPFEQCDADILVLSTEDKSEHGQHAENWIEIDKKVVRLGRTPGISTTEIRERIIEQERDQ